MENKITITVLDSSYDELARATNRARSGITKIILSHALSLVEVEKSEW